MTGSVSLYVNKKNVVVSAVPFSKRKSTNVTNAGARTVKKQRVRTSVFHETSAEQVTNQ